MRAMSLQRRRVNRRRARREQELFERAPWCWRCCRTDRPLHGHERLARSQGGDPERPDALLCDPCNTFLEDWPQDAAWNGWKISKKHQRNPDLAPDEAYDFNRDIVRFEVP